MSKARSIYTVSLYLFPSTDLINYDDLRCSSTVTSIQALNQIFCLATSFPGLYNIFIELYTKQLLLRGVPSSHEGLLASSRRALYSINDNAVNRIGKELLTLSFEIGSTWSVWKRSNNRDLCLCYRHRDQAVNTPYPWDAVNDLVSRLLEHVKNIVAYLK